MCGILGFLNMGNLFFLATQTLQKVNVSTENEKERNLNTEQIVGW